LTSLPASKTFTSDVPPMVVPPEAIAVVPPMVVPPEAIAVVAPEAIVVVPPEAIVVVPPELAAPPLTELPGVPAPEPFPFASPLPEPLQPARTILRIPTRHDFTKQRPVFINALLGVGGCTKPTIFGAVAAL